MYDHVWQYKKSLQWGMNNDGIFIHTMCSMTADPLPVYLFTEYSDKKQKGHFQNRRYSCVVTIPAQYRQRKVSCPYKSTETVANTDDIHIFSIIYYKQYTFEHMEALHIKQGITLATEIKI